MPITLDAETEAHVRQQAKLAGFADDVEQFVRDRLLADHDFDPPGDEERAALEALWAEQDERDERDEVMRTIRARQADGVEVGIPARESLRSTRQRVLEKRAKGLLPK